MIGAHRPNYLSWFRPQRRETARQTIERCREADAERIAAGEQDQYLWRQAVGRAENWADRYFSKK